VFVAVAAVGDNVGEYEIEFGMKVKVARHGHRT